MKVKLSHKQALGIVNVLKRYDIDVEKYESPFIHSVAKNVILLENEVKAIQKAKAAIKAYDDERILILKEVARKDKKGNPIFSKNGIVDIPEDNQEKFNVSIKELQEKYKKELEDFDKFMEMEESFELIEIPLTFMPKMNGPEMRILLPLIKS